LAKGQAMGLVLSSLKGPEKPQPFPRNTLISYWPQRKIGLQKETEIIVEKAKNPKNDMWINTVKVNDKMLSHSPDSTSIVSPNFTK